jgi:hypothetical protein
LSAGFDDFIVNNEPQPSDMATTSQVPLFATTSATSQDSFLLGNLNFHYPPGLQGHTPSTTYHTPSATAAPSHPRGSPTSSYDGHSASGLKRKSGNTDSDHPDLESEEAQVALKRQRNTLAARKYRQKRLDRISELEKALEDMTGERDSLKLQLARREAEVEALREMLGRR